MENLAKYKTKKGNTQIGIHMKTAGRKMYYSYVRPLKERS